MKEIFIVDRIEGNVYILEDKNSNIIDIEKCYIKTNVSEGAVLFKEGEYFFFDKKETKIRNQKISKLVKGLWVD